MSRFQCANYTTIIERRLDWKMNMITLHSDGGSQDFYLQDHFGIPFADEILKRLCQLLAVRDMTFEASLIASNEFDIIPASNDFDDDFYVMRTRKSVLDYEYWRKQLRAKNDTGVSFRNAWKNISRVIQEMRPEDHLLQKDIYVRFIVCEYDDKLDVSSNPENWREEFLSRSLDNNQALFDIKNSPKISKYGLNFRSKTEIKMYEHLVARGLFILPLLVAVMGSHRIRREPDFVIAYDGRIGVLEIHGEAWHPPETYEKEAERRRSMRNLGVAVYEVFSAKRCWNEPDTVVDEFLKAFN